MPMIPELHDVGKLLGLKKHWFEGFDERELPTGYDEETWLAIRFHGHKEAMSRANQAIYEKLRVLGQQPVYPGHVRRAMVLLSLADGVSSSSRILPEDARRPVHGFFPYDTPRICLWRYSTIPSLTKEETHGNPSHQEIVALLTDALFNQSWKEFQGKYIHDLNQTPEDKHPLRAMTSLAAHCELVGKIFRLLDRAVVPKGDELAGTLSLRDVEKVDSLKKARKSWSLSVLRVEILRLQHPIHTRDINIFPAIQEAIEQIQAGPFSDHVIFATSGALWLILLPGQDQNLDNILKPLLNLGLIISCVAKSSPFHSVTFPSTEELNTAESNTHIYYTFPRLPAKIDRDICEICQMRPGTREPPDEDTGVIETLCDCCESIRRRSDRFKKLAEWSEGPVLWCRVELNSDDLVGHVNNLYRLYLKSLRYDDNSPVIPTPEKVNILVKRLQPAALLAEYAQDYRLFLSGFWKQVLSKLNKIQLDIDSCVEQISGLGNAADVFTIKIERPGIPDSILDAFRISLQEWFPISANNDDCPVRIGLSIAPAKHPFFLHWENLKTLTKTINLFPPARLPVRANLAQLDALKQVVSGMGRSYLHNLAHIERQTGSRMMVEIKIIDDWKHAFLENVRKAGIAVTDVLGYHAMTEFGCE